jgi:hypothetical protein
MLLEAAAAVCGVYMVVHKVDCTQQVGPVVHRSKCLPNCKGLQRVLDRTKDPGSQGSHSTWMWWPALHRTWQVGAVWCLLWN